MPIVSITTKTKNPGNWGLFAEIARRLQVSRATVCKTNKNPLTSQRVAAALLEYQTTGRLPKDTRKPTGAQKGKAQ